MKILNEEVANQLTEIFQNLTDDVIIAVFTDRKDCDTCDQTLSYMKEIEQLSEKINLKSYDITDDKKDFEKYGIEHVPAISLLKDDSKDEGVKFYGIPAGHEINSLVTDILEVGGMGNDIPNELKEQLNSIDKPINIKVFVTLACPHCAGAVSKAHKLALENTHITGEMIEAQTFAELSDKHNVSSVPKIVINDVIEFVGNHPLDKFVEEILKA